MISNTCYELINTATELINFWTKRLYGEGVLLQYVDPIYEYKENHIDLYRYIAWAEDYDQSEENY
jgi:hypothetical protein